MDIKELGLNDFQVISFDCYGTLIDWETGIADSLYEIVENAGISCDELLKLHAIHESRIQSENPSLPYNKVLREVSTEIAESLRVPWTIEKAVSYGESVGTWPPFVDTIEALKILKKHFKLVILSNVDRSNFYKTNELLEIDFDSTCLAEDIGSYKPDLANFEFMIEQVKALGYSKSDILHVAESDFHDHLPANRVGLTNCRINRRKNIEGFGATAVPEFEPSVAYEFETLLSFTRFVGKEMGF